MGNISVVYGRINGATWKPENYFKLHSLNLEIINQLPELDTEYPYINRSMFSIANEQGIYRTQVITFGASYKGLEYEWHDWLNKFELILKKMYWWEAKIHVNFEMWGSHTYNWEIDIGKRESWFLENPKPICEWRFYGTGPRSFEEFL